VWNRAVSSIASLPQHVHARESRVAAEVSSGPGVNHRSPYPSGRWRRKAVSASFISAATFCIQASSFGSARRQDPRRVPREGLRGEGVDLGDIQRHGLFLVNSTAVRTVINLLRAKV